MNDQIPNTPIHTCEEVSYGKWMLSLLLLSIPILNLVLLIVWATKDYDGRKNYARAVLTYYAIYAVLLIVLFVGYGSLIASLL